MGNKTGIEWTDATWNPTTGCTKVSAGCKHCYAERDWARLVHLPAYQGRAFTDVGCHPDRLDQPLRWQKPRMIFVNSMSDLFHEAVPDSFIDQVFAVMAMAPQHTFQVLTKRPQRMREYFAARREGDPWAEAADTIADMIGLKEHPIVLEPKDIPLPHVWLGASIEDQPTADERIVELLATPAAVHWISAEPLLGPVHVGMYLSRTNMPGLSMMPGFTDPLPGVDWVVVGGESGPKARPMNPQWVRDLLNQCAVAGVPFLFKQWGEWGPETDVAYYADEKTPQHRWDDGRYSMRVGKKLTGRYLDDVRYDGYPEVQS